MIAAIRAPSTIVSAGIRSVIRRSIVLRVSRSKISAILSSVRREPDHRHATGQHRRQTDVP
jgi:hypothetical protein